MLNLPTFEELMAGPAATPVITKPAKRSVAVIDAAPVLQMTRVAGYARVSTGKEDQKSSIRIQRQHFLSQVSLHEDWESAGIFCDVVSGTKKEKRPQLQKLLHECEQGRVNLVLTKSISRFARNTTDLLQMVRSLTSLGVGIVFDRENIDTRAMDSEFLLTLLASLAEDESHSISSNCRWGIQKRFQDGTYRISTAPYGYDLENGNLAVNEAEAEVVREIFASYLSGSSLNAIAKDLNSRGIPTKRAGEIQKDVYEVSGRWTTCGIGKLLDSVTYTGDMILQKTYKDRQFITRKNEGQYPLFYAEEHHPPIISHDTFEAVKALREEKGKNSRKTANVKYAFTSILTCGCCGAPLARQAHKKGKDAWICREHRKKADRCPLPPIPETKLQEAFQDLMNRLHGCDDPVERYRRDEEKAWREAVGEKLIPLELKLDGIRKKLRILDATRTQELNYQAKRNKLRLELMEAESQLDSMKDNRISLIEELLQSVHGWDSSSSFDGDTFRRLVKSVTVNGKEEFTFMFRCGFSAASGDAVTEEDRTSVESNASVESSTLVESNASVESDTPEEVRKTA